MNDLRYAARQLLKNPGFSAVAVLTLALGIGANTALFTVINAVLLRSLPVKNPDELVQVMGLRPLPSYEEQLRRAGVSPIHAKSVIQNLTDPANADPSLVPCR